MMTYDNIVKFDYTEPKEWKKFVENYISPLYRSASVIVRLKKKIIELSKLIGREKSINVILLGGVDENGNYKPNSLAKVYKDILGVSVDVKEWVYLHKLPHDVDVSKCVKFKSFYTDFIQFVEEIEKITERVLLHMGVSRPSVSDNKIMDIINNPEKIIDCLEEIYRYSINILANYCYYTFFVLSMSCIPRYYIEQAYPKLKDEFEKVKDLLGLEKKFIPDVEDENTKMKYTLWGHKKDGLADLIYELNKTIWAYFRRESFRKVFPVENSKDFELEFKEMVNATLKEINWTYPEYIRVGEWREAYGRPYHREYEIEGIMLKKCYDVPSWSSISEREVRDFESISLIELFDDISPALFLGKIGCRIRYRDKPLYERETVCDYTLEIKGNRLCIR